MNKLIQSIAAIAMLAGCSNMPNAPQTSGNGTIIDQRMTDEEYADRVNLLVASYYERFDVEDSLQLASMGLTFEQIDSVAVFIGLE